MILVNFDDYKFNHFWVFFLSIDGLMHFYLISKLMKHIELKLHIY